MSYKLTTAAGSLLVVAATTPHVGTLFAPAYRQPAVRIVAAPVAAMTAPAPAPVVVYAPNTEPPAAEPEMAVYGDPKEPDFDASHPPLDAPPA